MKTPQQKSWILFLLLLLQSCNLNTSFTKTNSEIDKDLRNEIRVLNNRLFEAITSGDVSKARSMMSDKLLSRQTKKEIDSLLLQLGNAFKAKDYKVMDEYYVSNRKADVQNTIFSQDKGENGYKVSYKALDKEMYVSLLLPKGQIHDVLILAIYGKVGNNWKINILQFGQFSIFHKTAPEYLKLAKDSRDHSEMINAVTNIMLAKQCVTPGGGVFTYNDAKEIDESYEKILKKANEMYPLPRVLNSVKTNPTLFRVAPEIFDDGVFPMVHYVSKIDLKDTLNLRREFENIRFEVNRLFTGINKHKKYVLYRAYQELPDGKKLVKYYGFVDYLQ